MKFIFATTALCVACVVSHAAPQPPIISQGAAGRLIYQPEARGDRVPDFSHCGYAGGNAGIPLAPPRVVVDARPGDSTERIQRALDYVASLPADTSGVRGAVLLLKGRHEISGGLHMTNSGVVLRGQGAGEDETVLFAAGLDRRTLIRIFGRNDCTNSGRAGWQVGDDYVPVGSGSVTVKDAAGLKAGDSVRLIRPSAQAWIDQLGASEFGGGIGGGWKPGTRDLIWDRVITAIDGNRVSLDAPITTSVESKLGGGRLETYSWPGRIRNVGIENMCLESAFDERNARDESHAWCAVTMENAVDAWVRQVRFVHFAGSAVAVYESCKQVTVQDCRSLAPVSEDGGYRRNTYFTMGQQTLFLRCYAEQGRHDFSVGHCAAGPNAFVQCEARLPFGDSGPIESWAAGVLYDNVIIDGQALTLGFRPGNNAGIGWAAANCVLWNCSASVIRCWNPPGARNWSFGSWAGFQGDGIWRSSNDFVSPDSLYAGQLKDRMGPAAAERLKLMPRPHEESSNPPLDKAQELAAASHQPAPMLVDYIAKAAERDPIPSELGEAKPVEDLSSRSSRGNEAPSASAGGDRRRETNVSLLASAATMRLVITNGWLICDGKLLIGGIGEVAWWRGNIRPSEAPSFGLGVTRFVPGRIGPGFTDDLNELADTLIAQGKTALDYNYGLWHERRRDDHERVRRMDGEVLPPFYELPFARSGQGTAWDGLSKYDLTKFNPWYWSRLRQFAAICEQRGLVLFHQNYFQHNILEAGAHWADFPWRSANNVNETGFPEPPPYAGDKRIFQAELFYDVTHPVRRALHEGYIRQCLDNFATNSNVIQFTSAEFTGPLHFMQFWLDTIGAWEVASGILPDVESGILPGGKTLEAGSGAGASSRNGAEATAIPGGRMPPSTAGGTPSATKPIIALSCTKDVQDAILADSKRSSLVDVIDFRYWWRTEKGEFAPPGGKNLAPRQFERQWKGGRPADGDLAQMTADYHGRYPAKPVICDFDSAGWAFVCAGGSLPRLPMTTDAKLLAAIPRMQPWKEASTAGLWVLREPGRQLLIYSTSNAELDLSDEPGSFRANAVNSRTGEITPGESVKAGGKWKLSSGTLVWLRKE